MSAKLYRSRTDRMVGGVCGGLGQYLGIDPVIVRLFFVVLAFANGIGVLIYLVMWIIIPYEGQSDVTMREAIHSGADEMAERAHAMGSELRAGLRTPNPQAGLIIGAALVILGAVLLLQNIFQGLNIAWLRWFGFDTLWPLILIAGGVLLLVRRARGN
jgi:phage shock protein C